MASETLSAELRAEDVRQLWSLACLLSHKKLTSQLTQCLKPLCAVDCSSFSAEEQQILLQANVLLAEICSVACSNSKKADDRDLWTRRVIQTEKCINSCDAAIARGVPCSLENKLRLLKAKFLLQQQLKAERSAKNRRMLDILCEGLESCAETEDIDAELVAEFREYFGVKLKACLVKMHATTVMTKHNSGINSFAESLKYLRTTLPNYIDKRFLLWLVEVTCHSAISSFQPGSVAEMHQLVEFGQEFFDKVALERPVSPDFRMHHLIITGFYYLRISKITKVTPLLEEMKLLVQGTESAGVVKATYLDTIRDSMRVSVIACSDPKEALELANKTILAAQDNLRTYAQYSGCRYADMGSSIVQMTTLFALHKVDLQRTMFYRFFLARCHTLIAKYATAIGKAQHARTHLNYVVDKLLPAPTVDEASYPDAYLAVWVDVLEVAKYCGGLAGTQSPSASDENPTDVQIAQIYPNRVLLEWVARILEMEGLKHHIYKCCSAELRAKYDLALAKWMWATDSLSPRVTQCAQLEELRPTSFTLLHEALQCINASGACCETVGEIIALFGPQLVSFGEVEQGEGMLTSAIHSALQSKNVLLQMRLLANVFEIYSSKRLVKSQAATAAMYTKKRGVLLRRIAAAQAEEATIAALMRWTAGGTASTPSRG